MNQLLPFLQLFRWPNLLIIVLTQYLIRHCIILPLYPFLETNTSLGHFSFALLVLSTVLIAAAGYLINDYFDVATDAVNKPKKNQIGILISREKAMQLYLIMSALGIFLGFAIAWKIGLTHLGIVHVFTAAMLWFYSVYFQKKAFIGNFIISLLIALAILTVAFYEKELLITIGHQLKNLARAAFENWVGDTVIVQHNLSDFPLKSTILSYIYKYSLFAFLLTFVREIVKDMQDKKGDLMADYRTLPIVFGDKISKLFAVVLSLLTIYFIFRFQIQQYVSGEYGVAIAAFLLIQLPLFYVIWQLRLWRNTKSGDFKSLSNVLKGIMLIGLSYLFYFVTSIQYVPINFNVPSGYEIQNIQIDEIKDIPSPPSSATTSETDSILNDSASFTWKKEAIPQIHIEVDSALLDSLRKQ